MKKIISRVLIAIFVVVLFVAVTILMQYVQNLLYSDVQINLMEVVTQNKDVITSKIGVELNNLDMDAKQITERLNQEPEIDDDAVQRVFLEYSDERDLDRLFVATPNGTAYFSDGQVLDISGRQYFRLAMQGEANVSDRVVSRREGGEETFIISVPLVDRGEIIGTLQKFYTPEQMYEMCSISLFSSQGYMYIINSDGYILISSKPGEYSQESDNLYRTLYAQGNQTESQRLERDIRNNQSGFLESNVDGTKTFSAYTPIEELHDWYLISSVPVSAVSPNANIVIEMFYFILLFVVVVFTLFMVYFIYYKNKQQNALRKIAFVDTVTQGDTYNKFTIDVQNALHTQADQTFYLMSFDIDNFKYVNNYYGFDFGDKVLYQINHAVAAQLQKDECIARVSSDHFVVLLTDASPSRLNKLLGAIENEEGISIYLSAGVYEISNRQESVNLMADKAGTAAQSIKGIPHKKIEFYSEKFDQKMVRNEQVKRDIEQALAEDEVIPFYQPKVDVHSHKLVGAEALARWRKKDGSLVPPDVFIPVCEKTGSIVDLDMAIFRRVLAFLQRNLREGTHCVPISVNFSRLHLQNKDFLDTIVSQMEEYGIPPELIELELTESTMFENYNIMKEFIDHLHEHGLTVSMDDFGSGYSSLNMLKDVPIDTLKIDREFLRESTDSERQRIIFSTIAQMAKRLNINVVAEGVETQQNINLMKEFDCSIAQGYYFAKPLDEPEFETIYREGLIC